ncbi:MAG: SDR family NAD(P)-dependent oxidoreductase [Alphaproteobacteria bacterium]|nr:SDR family NAD(P)-dependent oxidoreductase [Alphaproteobacteria bacterium]
MPASKRTILITGCSSGIGLASVKTMKARGWRVLATARKAEDLRLLAEDVGVTALHLELSDEASVKACARQALEVSGGRIDALFNNGAYAQPGAVEDLTAGLLRQQFEVNLIGGHELTRLLIPQMRAHGFGRIVQCSSVLGLVSAPMRGAYCATKFALEALSDAMRIELKDTNIHVSLIEPGPIRTKFVATALEMLRTRIDIEGSVHREAYQRRLETMEAGGKQAFKLEPEAVAEKLVHAVESRWPKPRYFVTTPTYFADVMRRTMPTRLLDRVLGSQ